MSSGWIKFEKDLADDPRVKRMARDLRNTEVTHDRFVSETHAPKPREYIAKILGGLALLWFYADKHIRDDNTIPLGVDDVNEIVGIEGFAQIIPEHWLHVLDAETVELPDFLEHNGPEAKKAALNARRQGRHREKVTLEELHSKHSSNSGSVTDALPDKTRQDKTKQDLKSKNTRVVSRDDPEWFLDFKLAYPDRAGDKAWRAALNASNARIAEGHHPNEFLRGASAYAKFCEATGKVGTEFVMQAARFLGPGKPFLEAWNLPATKADTRLNQNLDVAAQFIAGAK